MNVNSVFPEDLGARDQYKLMKSPEVQKMTEAAGSVLDVAAWMEYETQDETTGETKVVLSIQTSDGEIFGTISKTFIKEFREIVSIFGKNVGLIKVFQNTSRSGRQYLTCTIE